MKCIDVEILLIRTVVSLISLFGCMWHLSDISRIYFSYETTVNVNFEQDSMVPIPGVTVCVNVSKTIREEYFYQRFPHLRGLTDAKVFSEPSHILSKPKY